MLKYLEIVSAVIVSYIILAKMITFTLDTSMRLWCHSGVIKAALEVRTVEITLFKIISPLHYP